MQKRFSYFLKQEITLLARWDENGRQNEIRAEVIESAAEHGVSFTRVNINSCLNPQEKGDVA